MKTDKLLPLLTKINKDKQLLNKSKPNLRIPNKTQAKLESDFKLNPFIRANSQSFNLGINPTLDFGKFSVGPYGVAGGPYDDPRLLEYGVRGSYDINPNMSISGDVNPNSFRLGLNYKFQNGRQTGTPGTPNYREMAIAQGIAPADYDKNKAIIDELLTEVILPGKYDPGFMTRAKIAIARSKYPNIDTIIANIDKGTYQEGGPTIKQMINSEHGQWMFPNQITGIKGGSFNQAGDYSTSLTGEGMLHNLLVLNPYGVKQLSPGTKQVSFPGNYQLEIPQARTGGSLPIAQDGLYARALQQYNDLKSGPAEAWNGDPAMVNPQGGLNLCLDCTRVDWENEADIRDVNRLIEEGYSMGTHENLDAYNNSLKKFNLTQPQYNSKSISQTATPQNRYGGLPKAQNGYEQAKAKYIELSQKGPMFQKQMQDLVKQFPLLANDVMVSAAGAISPAQQQNVKDAANRVVTNTLGRVISTPQSRADEERAKYVKEHPEKFREVAWIGKNGEVTQKSDPERGIAVPDMVLPEWQNPINYIGAARGLITNIGKGALNLTGLGTRTLSNAFNTPIIPNAAGLGARLGMTPTNYYNFAQAVNPITIGRVLTGMGLYEGAKNAPAYVNLIGDTYNTGVDAYNNKPGASEEFKKNAWNLAKQTGYYGLLAYGAKDLAKVPGLMKGVYDAEQVAEKVPTLYNKFSNWWHSDLPHNNYFGSFGNNVGLAEDLVNLEQEQPKIATLLNTAEEDIKFSKKWLEKKVRSETKSQLAPKDDKNVNQGTTDAGDLIQPGASGKIYAQNMGPFKFQYSPVDSSQGETLYNVAANSGINSNPLMFKYLQSNNMKTKFQDGGSSQEQQVAQLIQMYAQMTGMQPEDIVEKLKSLPQDQQQQALQSIAQEVQQAMAQQQGGAGQQMPMAQDGKQTGKKTPNYQPNWFARRTTVPGQVLGALANAIPFYGSHFYGIGKDIIRDYPGGPSYVPNTDVSYDDLSRYMINRRYVNMDPIKQYDDIIQNMSSEELENLSGPLLKKGGEPCFDCFDNYNPSPQAQNLEWFYKKAKGGLAKAAAGNEGECPTGYIRDHGGRCIPGPDLKNANRYRVYDPAIDSENPVDDLSIVNAIKRWYLGDNSVQNSARMGVFNPPGFWDALRLGYGSLGAFSPDIADEMSRRDSIENAHALELNKRLSLPDFTHRKQVLEKKSGGNTYMMDDLYQPGRQVKTKPEPPNYQPNWLARRTSVPGQILAGIGNTLPYFGSIMGKGVYDIAFNGGKPAYVPNTDITYDDLSYYMMNRRYLNQDPNPTYDKIIQNLTPEELEQISGPIFKGGGQSFNEAFPQAQTYLPYDRPGETRPNFMFAEGGDTDDQWGGQPDIDQIYNVMKKGGMAKDPKKKNGKDWDPNDFLSYMRSGGGLKKKVDIELPKHDLTGPVTGKYKDPNPKSPWTYDYQNGKWTGYNKGKSYDISKYQSSVDILNKAYPDVVNPKTTTDPFDAGNVYGTTESKADEGYVTNDPGVDALDASGANTDPNNPNKKQNKKQPMRSLINPRDLLTGAAMQSKNKAGFLPTIAAAVNTIGVIGDVARGYGNLGRLAGSAFKSNKGYTPMPAAPAGYTDYNPPSSAQSAPMSFSNIPSPYEQFNQEASDPNSMYYNPSVKRKGGRIELPKKQMWKSQVAGSEINPSKSAYLMPDAGGLREGAIYDEWSKKNPMRTMDSFYQANTATDAQGNELYSYRPGSDADPNSPTFNKDTGKPEFNKDAGKKGFNLEYNPVEAERASASLLQINSVLAAHNQNKEDRANEWNMKGSERINPVQGAMDQGDYLTNSPQGNDFRPNQHTFAQDPGRGYNNQQLQNVGKSIYSKHGGSIWDRYREDEEIDLDDLTLEDLREIYANGGTIEFLD